MASSIIKKANARLKFLYRKKAYLNEYTKRLLVSSLIQCHFDYACSFWYPGLTKFWKDKLQVTQNKLIRFVLNLEHSCHIDQHHFISLGWLPASRRVELISLCHVFKINNSQSPDYMGHLFVKQDSVHAYQTRSSQNGSCVPKKVKGFGLKSFSYLGCKLWNMLPPHIRQLPNISSFKRAVKDHFFNENSQCWVSLTSIFLISSPWLCNKKCIFVFILNHIFIMYCDIDVILVSIYLSVFRLIENHKLLSFEQWLLHMHKI